MDWQLFGMTFGLVFLAELGDKSQLVAIALSGNCKYPQAIFFGSAIALVLASLLGVVAGEGVAQVLPTHFLKGVAALVFAGMGLGLLWSKSES